MRVTLKAWAQSTQRGAWQRGRAAETAPASAMLVRLFLRPTGGSAGCRLKPNCSPAPPGTAAGPADSVSLSGSKSLPE